jgi:hypothetical protein
LVGIEQFIFIHKEYENDIDKGGDQNSGRTGTPISHQYYKQARLVAARRQIHLPAGPPAPV